MTNKKSNRKRLVDKIPDAFLGPVSILASYSFLYTSGVSDASASHPFTSLVASFVKPVCK
jgi:hypothetical protein